MNPRKSKLTYIGVAVIALTILIVGIFLGLNRDVSEGQTEASVDNYHVFTFKNVPTKSLKVGEKMNYDVFYEGSGNVLGVSLNLITSKNFSVTDVESRDPGIEVTFVKDENLILLKTIGRTGTNRGEPMFHITVAGIQEGTGELEISGQESIMPVSTIIDKPIPSEKIIKAKNTKDVAVSVKDLVKEYMNVSWNRLTVRVFREGKYLTYTEMFDLQVIENEDGKTMRGYGTEFYIQPNEAFEIIYNDERESEELINGKEISPLRGDIRGDSVIIQVGDRVMPIITRKDEETEVNKNGEIFFDNSSYKFKLGELVKLDVMYSGERASNFDLKFNIPDNIEIVDFEASSNRTIIYKSTENQELQIGTLTVLDDVSENIQIATLVLKTKSSEGSGKITIEEAIVNEGSNTWEAKTKSSLYSIGEIDISPIDLVEDGKICSTDAFKFIEYYKSQDLRGDLNKDKTVGIRDFADFIKLYNILYNSDLCRN